MAASTSEYRLAQQEISRLAQNDVRTFLSTLDLSDGRAVREALMVFLPLLVEQYGAVAALLAVEWYDELRAESGSTSTFFAEAVSVLVDTDELVGRVYRGLTPLFGAEPDEVTAINHILGLTDELVLQPGRDTITENAQRDPAKARWIRVPSGSETCAFCLVLAGASYKSEQSAIYKSAGGKFHEMCDCVARPIWKEDINSDDASVLNVYEQMYQDAKNSTGETDIKSLTAAMREQHSWLTH